ncbi:Glycosyl transferase group 1 family protein [Candidatus Erwinia haradaeae]|uniref:Glycosyl transferase group 1 family protein n=1 Tax=Candidatus Erwinia haradaeae TaxID=1922217 RepID=A0A451DJ87_9GAMM|nr:glycosyltransferase [Candidatus Erwinia haradaeae]VFP86736.1 Glycosyl transferase group 1 family protein [Candidatus Erwinia haradaeae]
MRILMIIDGLSGGGAEKVVLTLCQEMSQLGHKIQLLSLRNICQYPLPRGVNYQVLDGLPYASFFKKLKQRSYFADALSHAINVHEQKQGAYDLMFSHLHNTDRIVSQAHFNSIEKIWFCIHGMLSTAYLGHRHALDLWRKKRAITKIYTNKNVISVSNAVAQDLTVGLSIQPSRLVVINNPFQLERILAQAAKKFNLPQSPYIIHVGRFHPHKRHDRLLFAYVKSGIQAKLVLAGCGTVQQINIIQKLAEKLKILDRLIFTGFQINPYPLIKHAKMLVLSSDSEGFGNVLVEALLCGTPVVSTRCPGGPIEILEKSGMGNALTDLNSHALAEKMAEVYRYPPDPIDKKHLNIYDCKNICQQYLRLALRS